MLLFDKGIKKGGKQRINLMQTGSQIMLFDAICCLAQTIGKIYRAQATAARW